jgi:hypothetical protein
MASKMTWFGTFQSTAAAKYESKVEVYPLFVRDVQKDTSDSFTFALATVTGRQTQACQSDL